MTSIGFFGASLEFLVLVNAAVRGRTGMVATTPDLAISGESLRGGQSKLGALSHRYTEQLTESLARRELPSEMDGDGEIGDRMFAELQDGVEAAVHAIQYSQPRFNLASCAGSAVDAPAPSDSMPSMVVRPPSLQAVLKQREHFLDSA